MSKRTIDIYAGGYRNFCHICSDQIQMVEIEIYTLKFGVAYTWVLLRLFQ